MKKNMADQNDSFESILPEYGRRKLLTYADSIRDLADTFNGMMMIPNLIGVLVLSPLVYKITRNYVDRVLKGKDEKPMLSAFPEIQKEQEKTL